VGAFALARFSVAVGMLRQLARAYVINRLLRGSRHRHPAYARSRYGRRRGRTGFFGPFPYYSGRTRRGSRVTVSGCCLPIPLGVFSAFVLAAWRLAHR
jgi:hypothetical protein